ncbi:MAG: S41 family peptidase, partial [Bacteroidota bacterium]|nr:S41 family peptidase [Bacteroidota bacterium]
MYKFSGAGYFRSLAVAASMVLFVSGAYGQKSFDVSRQFDVLHSLYRELDEYYVDSLSPEKILNNAINGMMASFDPYTNYIPESETGDLKFLTTGEYGGVGAMIRPYKDKVVVTETYENTPAQKAGILAGDELLEINNVKMSGGNSQRASELLKGQPGTEVKVVVKREGVSHPITKKIIRQLVLINQVGYYGLVGPKTGYINLSGFTDKASQEVRHAFLELKNQGAQKLIFDLRGNGGGLLNEAVAICNLF